MMDFTERILHWPPPLASLAFVLLGYILLSWLRSERPCPGIPVIQPDRQPGLKSLLLPDKFSFFHNGRELLAKGKQTTTGCFQIRATSGYRILVPNRFVHELRAHPALGVSRAFEREFFPTYPGFDGMREGMREDHLMADVVRLKLTQALNLVMDDVVDEADNVIHLWFGESPEWKTHVVKTVVLDVIARVSSRVFIGKELARNERWLQIAKQNAITTFQGSFKLRQWPAFLRPLVHWFIPDLVELRKQVRDARKLATPEAEKAQARRAKALDGGERSIYDWMIETANGRPINFVAGQLLLSMASILNTTEFTTQALIQLCETPEVVQPLRDEIIQVLKQDGWAKTAMSKMKLLDSFLKEVQRCRPFGLTTMARYVEKAVTLSDGTTLPAGSFISFLDDKVQDPSVYPSPEKFEASRFLNMREKPGEENKHQLVTTSPDHLAFGHGTHACPGRFFATVEVKIILCFMLLQYDLRFEPGYSFPPSSMFETQISVPEHGQIQVRRRREEIDLLTPKVL